MLMILLNLVEIAEVFSGYRYFSGFLSFSRVLFISFALLFVARKPTIPNLRVKLV